MARAKDTGSSRNPKRKATPEPQKKNKKNKTRNDGGPSSVIENPPIVIAPDDLHPWLRFTEPLYNNRLRNLWKKSFVSNKTFDYDLLSKLGVKEQIKGLLKPLAWERLFSIDDTAYEVLTLEFLSTFQFHNKHPPFSQKKAITFRLGGQAHECFISEWAIKTGLYEKPETEKSEFDNAWLTWASIKDAPRFWKEIANGPYNASQQKGRQLDDPVLRILHRAISHSIAPTKGSPTHLTKQHLFYIFCMKKSVTCNVAHGLATYFAKYATDNPGGLCGGSFVSKLAENYGILTAEVKAGLRKAANMKYLNEKFLLKCGILVEKDDEYVLAPWGGVLSDERPKAPPRRVIRGTTNASIATATTAAADSSIPTETSLARYSSMGAQIRGLRSDFDEFRKHVDTQFGALSAEVKQVTAEMKHITETQQQILQVLARIAPTSPIPHSDTPRSLEIVSVDSPVAPPVLMTD